MPDWPYAVAYIFHFLLAWPTLRIRNADCLRCKQCDNVVAPWGAGISISISIIEPKVKSKLTSQLMPSLGQLILSFFPFRVSLQCLAR